MILSIFKLIYNYDLRSFTISLISKRLLLIFIAEAGEVGGVGPKLLAFHGSDNMRFFYNYRAALIDEMNAKLMKRKSTRCSPLYNTLLLKNRELMLPRASTPSTLTLGNCDIHVEQMCKVGINSKITRAKMR